RFYGMRIALHMMLRSASNSMIDLYYNDNLGIDFLCTFVLLEEQSRFRMTWLTERSTQSAPIAFDDHSATKRLMEVSDMFVLTDGSTFLLDHDPEIAAEIWTRAWEVSNSSASDISGVNFTIK